MTESAVFAQRNILISCGGLGGAANVAAKAAVKSRLAGSGFEDSVWIEHLHVDFMNAADSPSAELIERYGDHVQPLSDAETVDLVADAIIDLARENDVRAFSVLL